VTKLASPAPGRGYTPEQRDQAIRLAAEIGRSRAAKQLGIGYLTLRRWTDPEFLDKERAEKKDRRRAPCIQCGRITNIHGRKYPELGLLCHPCLSTRLADQRRGWTAEEMTVMYNDERMSTNEIAAMTGLSQSGVYAVLRRHGVQMRTVHEGIALHPGGPQEHGKVDPEEIRQLSLAGMSVTKIATEVACSRGTVLYHLDRMGLRLAKPRPSRGMA
jgi:hypothetical protein